MSFHTLRYETDGRVATVWLDRPPVNAVDRPMYREIHALFSQFDQHLPGVSAVVLTGSGRHFCAGNDLDEFERLSPDNARQHMFDAREAFWALQDAPVPVIGAVRGAALGTGLVLASSCDFVVASEDATLGLPEIKVGVMGGAKHLGRWLPQPLVRLMFFTGEPLSARQLLHHGAVVDVVPDAEVLDRALSLATKVSGHAPTAIRLAKESLNGIETLDLRRGYEFEQSLTCRFAGHPESRQSLEALRQGRIPDFAAVP